MFKELFIRLATFGPHAVLRQTQRRQRGLPESTKRKNGDGVVEGEEATVVVPPAVIIFRLKMF